MKKLFQAIRKKENDTVRELLAKKPELVRCTAKQPPKKDDGQSPLQVAFKTGNFEAVNLLLDLGADVTKRESYGTTAAERFCITAEQILPRYSWGQHKAFKTAVVTPEWQSALSRIVALLQAYGADFSPCERYYSEEQHPLRPFLALVFER